VDLLRFVIAGSVDDGKSTLVGRLLHDAGVLYEDHVEALAKLAGRAGGGGKIDLSLVTDGLKAEREQGVTIDVAYRYFSTPRRRFMVIDTPGHEQYTRNMATGASNADLAILLVDAKLGLLTQTRRHAFICSLLGIPRIVVALNKMDLVGHSQARFDEIRTGFEAFAARLGFKSVTFIPVSALDGDNVVRPSTKMPWYSGQPLLEHLETVYIGGDRNLVDFRMPVQSVMRAGAERWYGGRIGSGVVKVGDEVTVLPSHRRSRVRAIGLGERKLDAAFAPLSVALSLEDDIDVGRGAMLAHPRNLPRGVRALDAMVVWMDDKPLAPGRVYQVKHGASWVRASCAQVDYRVDPDTLHRSNGKGLGLNDIGRAHFTLFEERFVDSYARNRATGAFVLVDPETGRTAGAGMVVERETEHPRVAPGAAAKRIVVPHASKVTADSRAALLGQRAVTVWLTGLSGAGKSTIATELEKRLVAMQRACYMLDGDNVRAGINRDLGFGPDDRRENIRRVAEVARLMNDAGLVVVTAFISPYRADREMARDIIGAERFLEVYLDAPLEVCEGRDPKGLYKKARKGEIPEFTGVSAPYEVPASPEIVLRTGAESVEKSVEGLLAELLPRIRKLKRPGSTGAFVAA
jgi:bifunctional enzyme CysN/CysC